jgi:hypothetical protein
MRLRPITQPTELWAVLCVVLGFAVVPISVVGLIAWAIAEVVK